MSGSFKLRIKIAAAVAALLLWAAGAVAAVDFIKDSECLDCHKDKTLTTTNSAGHEISLFVEEAKLRASVHKTNACAVCHSDLTRKHPDDNIAARPVNCALCHEKQSESYGASVHGVANRKGELSAATCSDCHDGHTIMPPNSPDSPLHFSRLAQTCGACHDQEAKDVEESVHGKAVAAGHRDAPTCTDCHSEHKIEGLRGTTAMAASADLCSRCHASERLNTKYNLPADRVQTFFESYHGLASKYGSTLAANCGSCHGSHRVLPSTDLRSTVNKGHLVETCGKCHPGATENFALSKVHVANTSVASGGIGEQINWWVRRLYLVLIVSVIGGMLFHNGLLMARKMAAMSRARTRPYIRMNLAQRLQHATLALSFIALAITGFALKYPDSWVAWLLGSNEPFRRGSHRVAAVVLIAGGLWHILYVVFTKAGRQLVKDFYPSLKDVKDVITNLRYLLGRSEHKARIARFGYAEKMEYWAVVWGTLIMGATGLMIWFKIDFTRFLPRWAVDIALTIHYYEAILACLAIVVWHFYHVIFDPDVYPLNWACWDGRVTKHWHEEEHELYEPSAEEIVSIPRPTQLPEPAVNTPDYAQDI